MHHLISLGIAHLRGLAKFDPNANYPVYIDEPLVVLSLSSLFEKQTWTKRKTWITNSLAIARNPSSLGFIFEELALLIFMEKFGGKYTALGDVFHLADSSLLSKKVTLVSLRRTTDGVMECCQAAWNAGSSDRFGYKANSPGDVIAFLEDPKGIPILFPDTHMGPDFIGFFKEKETGELILFAGQGKVTPSLDVATWIKAINSVTPELFYTVVVRFKPFWSCNHN